MLTELEKSWQAFKSAPPGSRFERLYAARRSSGESSGIVFTVIGVLLVAGGVVLLFIPGPGLPLIAFGAALIARQSLWVAKRADRAERALRSLVKKARRFWRRSTAVVRAAVVAPLAIGAAGAAYLGYSWLFKN